MPKLTEEQRKTLDEFMKNADTFYKEQEEKERRNYEKYSDPETKKSVSKGMVYFYLFWILFVVGYLIYHHFKH